MAAVLAGAANGQAALTTEWPTYHLDPGRSGFDDGEPSFWSMQPAWATFPAVDGTMDAAPLVHGSTVIVATENDSIYGFDVHTGAQLWMLSNGTPRHSQPFCGAAFPQGITSTPDIDGSHL